MLEKLYTLPEIAAAAQVSVPTLRRAVKSGALPCIRAGKRGQIRVTQAGLDAYLLGHQNVPDVDVAPRARPTREAPPSPILERKGKAASGRSYRILVGDVRPALEKLETGTVHCAVTSPPYYWQRDYKVDGQIGHEATIEAYVSALVDAFREVRRALVDDGTFFLNLGDAYYNAKGRPHGHDPKHSARLMARERLRAVDGPGLGLPRKSLIGLPWRVALAMQADGWVLRSSIVWHRPNALGEPTGKDRPWRTHENIFLFSKSPRYFFDRKGLAGAEDVWTIPARPENPYAHCAPFPVELVERCLACGCKPGGVVLDPFLGSGTTIVAAHRFGSDAIGVELNAEYAALAERRLLDKAPGRKAKATTKTRTGS